MLLGVTLMIAFPSSSSMASYAPFRELVWCRERKENFAKLGLRLIIELRRSWNDYCREAKSEYGKAAIVIVGVMAESNAKQVEKIVRIVRAFSLKSAILDEAR